MLADANNSSRVGPQNKLGHPARRYTQLTQIPVLSARGIEIGSKAYVTVFLGWHFSSFLSIQAVR